MSGFGDDVNEAQEKEKQLDSPMNENGGFLCHEGLAVLPPQAAFWVEGAERILRELKRAGFKDCL